MATMIFSFEKEKYKLLKFEEISPLEFITSILMENGSHHDPDGGNSGTIIRQLLSYHDTEGGAPEIDEFDVVDVTYNYSTKTGKIELSYYVSRYYGCSDLNSSDDDYETWNFKLNTKECSLIIDAPDFERLSPGEEL